MKILQKFTKRQVREKVVLWKYANSISNFQLVDLTNSKFWHDCLRCTDGLEVAFFLHEL
jgi:hypothetical protein